MKIYLCEWDDPSDEVLSSLLALLPPKRREKVGAYQIKRDKIAGAVGFLLVRRMIADALPEFGNPDWESDGNGRPYLPGLPYDFNLSHADGICCAVMTEKPVKTGCDVEMIRPLRPSLVARFANGGDLEKSRGAADFPVLLWTKKEAVGKAEGIGMKQNWRSIPTGGCDSILLPRARASYWCSVFPGDGNPETVFLKIEDLFFS